MSKLVLIDGHAILHRAFHALPPLTNSKGQQINAVYGFVAMLLKIITDLKPTHLAVCFDRPEETFRKKEFKDYQAHRPETASELVSQFEIAKDIAGAIGIPIYEKARYEADDLIGTIANRLTKNEKHETKIRSSVLSLKSTIDEVVIVTGDRDILQLVNDKKGVKIFMPQRGLSEGKLYGEKETHERMGVPPKLIPDYKALVGDPSDNYPGVSGIGPKTAEKLLEKYDGINHLYQHLDDIDPKVAEKLKKGRDSAFMSHKLATIVQDVAVEIDVNKMKTWNVSGHKVIDLFSELGFKTLTKRVEEVGKMIQSEKQLTLV